MRTGRCLCGAVRFACEGEPQAMGVCHCRDCQYVSGGEPAAVVIFPRAAFRLTQGETRAYAVKGDSGGEVARNFCPTCGTPIFSLIESAPAVIVVKAGALDEASDLVPSIEFYADTAHPWAHRPPGVASFPRAPG